MTDADRRSGIARENAMAWAMQISQRGEDPMAILARAQLFEEYVLAAKATPARKPAGFSPLKHLSDKP